MSREEVVLRIIRMLWLDYGVAFCAEEEPLFALKLWMMLEEI